MRFVVQHFFQVFRRIVIAGYIGSLSQTESGSFGNGITLYKGNVLRVYALNAQLEKGFLNATDAAEHLVVKGIPFREAHEIVGHMVRACEKKRCRLEDLTDADLALIDPRLSRSTVGDIGIRACVNARRSHGGTAPAEVRRQVAAGREWLARARRD